MILADVTMDVTRSKNWVPGVPAEVVYRPCLVKPDRRDATIRELRRQLRADREWMRRADELLARAAENVMHAEQHHRAADCWKCAAERVSAA